MAVLPRQLASPKGIGLETSQGYDREVSLVCLCRGQVHIVVVDVCVGSAGAIMSGLATCPKLGSDKEPKKIRVFRKKNRQA